MINVGILAQAAPAAGNAQGGGMMSILLMLLIFVVFYVILILPESKRRKKLANEVKAMKQGDKVVTSGGIIGTIDFIGEKTVYLKSQDSKIEVSKDAIAGILK